MSGSTRKRTIGNTAAESTLSSNESSLSANGHSSDAVQSSSDLPPPRQKKGLQKVEPPLSSAPMHRFIYYMALAATLVGVYYGWRLLQWKSEVGGWWNLALGRNPAQHAARVYGQNSGGNSEQASTLGGEGSSNRVEDRLNALADALGMPSGDLASAIAGAVKEYVPPASLSSIAARETGPSVKVLLGDKQGNDGVAQGVVGGVAGGLGKIVGTDDAPEGGA